MNHKFNACMVGAYQGVLIIGLFALLENVTKLTAGALFGVWVSISAVFGIVLFFLSMSKSDNYNVPQEKKEKAEYLVAIMKRNNDPAKNKPYMRELNKTLNDNKEFLAVCKYRITQTGEEPFDYLKLFESILWVIASFLFSMVIICLFGTLFEVGKYLWSLSFLLVVVGAAVGISLLDNIRKKKIGKPESDESEEKSNE